MSSRPRLALAAFTAAVLITGCTGTPSATESTQSAKPVAAPTPPPCDLTVDPPLRILTNPVTGVDPCWDELDAMRDKAVKAEQKAKRKAAAKAAAERAAAEEAAEEEAAVPSYAECAELAGESPDGIPPQVCLDTYGDEGATVDENTPDVEGDTNGDGVRSYDEGGPRPNVACSEANVPGCVTEEEEAAANDPASGEDHVAPGSPADTSENNACAARAETPEEYNECFIVD